MVVQLYTVIAARYTEMESIKAVILVVYTYLVG